MPEDHGRSLHRRFGDPRGGRDLYVGEKLVNDMDPKERNITMIFQSYALYSHLTVFSNMTLPFENVKAPEAEIARAQNIYCSSGKPESSVTM